MAPKKVLITGGAGMLGKECAAQLSKLGVQVVCTDRSECATKDGQTFIKCDLNDKEGLEKACQGCDVVIHFGGVSGPGFVFNPPVPAGDVAEANITGTMHVLEAARKAGVKRIVYSSSCIVYWPVDRARYGKDSPALVEGEAKLDSTETYGASKIASEYLCRSYSAMGSIDTVSLRIGWVYGRGRTTGCVVRALIDGIAMDTPPEHRRDLVYIEDAAQACVQSVMREANFNGIALNVSGAHVKWSEVEDAVREATGNEVKRAPISDKTIDPYIPAMSLNKVGKELGYAPKWSIKDGVKDYAQYLKETGGDGGIELPASKKARTE